MSVRDVGRHRLKGLRTPERVFQLCHADLDDSFPAWLGHEPSSVRSLDDPALPNNLPRYPAPLIGRDNELVVVQGLVVRSQLVTLTGSGGAGKTRLAVQVAADLLDGSGDGVWLVELAAGDRPGPGGVDGGGGVAGARRPGRGDDRGVGRGVGRPVDFGGVGQL